MQYVYDSPGIAEPCRPAFNAGATEERLGECVQQLADEEHNLSGITSIKFRVFCILFFDGWNAIPREEGGGQGAVFPILYV